MTARHLSPEVVSLIHHVELNQSGWWKKAVGQVIKGVLWSAHAPLSFDALKKHLHRDIGARLADEVLRGQLEVLVSQDAVTKLPSQDYKLTEQMRKSLSAANQTAVAEQDACRAAFLQDCSEYCPELPAQEVWDKFTHALLESVRVAGANLFHLLADGNLQKEVDWLSSFLDTYPSKSAPGLRLMLARFFAPNNQACRSQVLRLMTAHFFAEASQLSPETITAIEGARKKRKMKVVLDTNFVFSVLQLHDNPADEAALSLIDIAHEAGHQLEINLFVLPATLDEAQKTLTNQMHLVERIRTTTAMSQAALTQPLPSIAKRFFEAARNSPGLTAQAFFQPYIDELQTILRGKGIHVLDTNCAVYKQDQAVIDDLLEEQRREESEVPAPRRKGYETLMHDVVLWHAVKDRRAGNAASPFDVEYWAVSIDWRLIAFDRRKRLAESYRLPVVLHPNNLVQLVQFWVPRSEKLAGSLIDTLQLPLFFHSFDPEDERATVKVLEAISRFENVGDIPEATLKIVLANQVLRDRLKAADASNDVIFELVREEMLAQHKEVVSTLGQVQDSLSVARTTLLSEQEIRTRTEQALGETSAQLEKVRRQVNLAETRASVAENERIKEASELKTALAAKEQMAEQLAAKLVSQRFVFLFWIAPWLLGVILGFIAFGQFSELFPAVEKNWVRWAIVGAAVVVPFAVACLFAERHVEKYPSLACRTLARFSAFFGAKAIALPGGLALAAIYQDGVLKVIKALIDPSGTP
jgi:hypothetical protein